jgi:hypothetical protein
MCTSRRVGRDAVNQTHDYTLIQALLNLNLPLLPGFPFLTEDGVLGNPQAGAGPRFKGRGLIQITGRSNYTKYGGDRGKDYIADSTPLCWLQIQTSEPIAPPGSGRLDTWMSLPLGVTCSRLRSKPMAALTAPTYLGLTYEFSGVRAERVAASF